MVCADMLGYAACFAAGDAGFADGVKQGGLAVVDVSHNGYDRRTGKQAFRAVDFGRNKIIFFGEAHFFHFIAKFGGDKSSRVDVERTVDSRHNAKIE